jgi:hypothetical protein
VAVAAEEDAAGESASDEVEESAVATTPDWDCQESASGVTAALTDMNCRTSSASNIAVPTRVEASRTALEISRGDRRADLSA